MDDFISFVPVRKIASPCVNVCEIEAGLGLCRGCARTTDEIARWTGYSDAERSAIMRTLPGRR